MEPSTRSGVAPFYVMEVMRAAAAREAAGSPVLHLEVGQPSTGAPAGAARLRSRPSSATSSGTPGRPGCPNSGGPSLAGTPATRPVEVDLGRIVVTTGASGSCVLGFLALFEAGQRVAVLEPGYPCYRNDLEVLGIDAVPVALHRETGFRPTIDGLEAIGPSTVSSSPAPRIPPAPSCGPAAGRTRRVGRRARVRLVVDEIYHGITYGGPAPTALALGPDVGRHQQLLEVLLDDRVAARLARRAAGHRRKRREAGPEPHRCSSDDRAGGGHRRLRLCRRARGQRGPLPDQPLDRARRPGRAGLDRSAPADGAFYVWTDVADLGIDSQELCRRWLEEIGVAATPGIDFDRVRGSDFVRFSYAGDPTELREAMTRLAAWVERRTMNEPDPGAEPDPVPSGAPLGLRRLLARGLTLACPACGARGHFVTGSRWPSAAIAVGWCSSGSRATGSAPSASTPSPVSVPYSSS